MYWPSSSDLSSLLVSLFPTAAFSDAANDILLGSAIREFKESTKRTWEPVTETRYFNGNGGEILVIDEYIEVTNVELVRVTPVNMTRVGSQWWEVSRSEFPKTQLAIYQGGSSLVFGYPLREWPIGMENVKIDATWGYGCELPEDARLAILYKAASDMLNAASMRVSDGGKVNGPMVKWTDGDISASYADLSKNSASAMAGWDKHWKATVRRYKRTAQSLRDRTTVIFR